MASKNGFTLVELAIVLVIIGLLVGGVLAGQELIRQSQLRSIQKDWNNFETADYTFRNKYNCRPGDCLKASEFGLGTSGNGNKIIDHWGSGPVGFREETYRFWMHLANAGLIEGSYTGVSGPGHATLDTVLWGNIPGSKIEGVGHFVFGYSSQSNSYGLNTMKYQHFYTGSENTAHGSATLGGAFSLNEVIGVDVKLDDGLANQGKVRIREESVSHNTIGCTTGSAPNHAYGSSPTALCHMIYGY